MSPYSDSPRPGSPGPRKRGKRGKPQARHAVKKKSAGKRRRRGGGGGGGGGGGSGRSALTSHPTSRNAQMDTRAWLLKQHGPVCAYCGLKYSAREITLDHVAPRRGLTAYDRRDNLVLACKTCNAAKRDLPPLAFLLGLRSRAVHLVRYGAHLSAGLLELARALIPGGGAAKGDPPKRQKEKWNELIADDEDSPYRS